MLWIQAPSIGVNTHHHINTGTQEIALSTTILQTSNKTIENKTIHLLSDTDISVNVITSSASYGQEGFLALPFHDSARQFVVATPKPYSSSSIYSSVILVASYKNETAVSITFPQDLTGTMIFNYSLSFTLKGYQTYMLQSKYDLSGTYIQSSQPVSVVAGNSYAYHPNDISYSYLIEQVPPSGFYGNGFIVPPLQDHTSYTIKLLSHENRISITLFNSTGSYQFMLYRDFPLQMRNENEPLFISSASMIMVVQFGDVFMQTVPSISNYLSRYDFLIPTKSSIAVDYICIISKTGGVLLDSSRISAMNTTYINTINGNFTIMTANITVGRHTLNSPAGNNTFGAFLYGYLFKRYGYGYGFPLGMKTNSVGCMTANPQVPISFTDSPHFHANGVKTTAMAQMQPHGSTGSGIYCFNCPEVSQVFLCNSVQRCQLNEICSVASYTTSSGSLAYRTTCINEEICTSHVHHSGTNCLECCRENFCNLQGCSSQGLPPPSSRAPICLDCQHIDTISKCTTVTLCHHDQICRVEELHWGDTYKHFNLGCAPTYQCLTARRSLPISHTCCEKDFCNSNYTGSLQAQLIG